MVGFENSFQPSFLILALCRCLAIPREINSLGITNFGWDTDSMMWLRDVGGDTYCILKDRAADVYPGPTPATTPVVTPSVVNTYVSLDRENIVQLAIMHISDVLLNIERASVERCSCTFMLL